MPHKDVIQVWVCAVDLENSDPYDPGDPARRCPIQWGDSVAPRRSRSQDSNTPGLAYLRPVLRLSRPFEANADSARD